MADKRMNEFIVASNGAYIYAESSDGTQVKVSMSNLFKEQFIYRGRNTGINADNLDYGLYSMYETDVETYNYPFVNGFIFSFRFGNGTVIQIAINPVNNIYIRNKWNSWSGWKYLH